MTQTRPALPPTARRVTPLLDFLRSESAGGLTLMLATVTALIWSNSDASADYFHLIELPIGLGVGRMRLQLSAEAWVNDGLMAVFFLAVALEIRREMTEGRLATLRQLAAPGLAAVGGMIVPGLIYVAFNHADPETLHGWAVPVATDIAFALAALSTLGRLVPIGLKVFLTALAILDDLGAIVVIALFYTAHLNLIAAWLALLVWLVMYGLNRAGVRSLTPYLLGGAVLWACVFGSGIHPTLAGVALAFVIPAGGKRAPAARLEHGLGRWVAWVVLPLFGLANAGLRLDTLPLGSLTGPVVLGTVLGLVIGKQIGVFGATLAAVRSGLAQMPAGLSWAQIYGGSVLCGIGFTMSLFIGDLSFHGHPIHNEVKLAVFLGSLISAVLGLIVLAFATRRRKQSA